MVLPATTTLLAFLVSFLRTVSRATGNQIFFQAEQKDYPIRSPVLDNRFTAWLEETGNARGMKGVAIAVTYRNKDGGGWTTETKGFGVADRWGTPVDDKVI